jgi:alkylation response protein AidB-like acyl-CoA dehydrogenase
MFDLDITEETSAVVALCRAIARDVLSPNAKGAEKSASMPSAVRSAFFETGLTTPVAEVYGGGGIPSCSTKCAAIESLAYGDPALTMAAVWSGSAAFVVGVLGTAEQQETLLPPFAINANAHGVVALYEGYGRSPKEYVTKIDKSSGAWRVAGVKLAVSALTNVDLLLVVGVDSQTNSLRVAKLDPKQVVVSSVEGGIALDAAQLANITFDCAIEESQLIGGPHCDQNATSAAICQLRLLIAAALLGTAQRSIDYASQYATERIAFGKPISAFQGVSFLLAESSIRVAAARVEVADVAAQIDMHAYVQLEAQTTAAINYAATVSTQATRDALQVLGGHGFITDHPVELWYRSAAALAALDFDPLLTAFEPAL